MQKTKLLELKEQVEKSNPSLEIKQLAQKYKTIFLRENSYKIEFLKTKGVDDNLLSEVEALTGKDVFCHIIPKEIFNCLSPRTMIQDKPKIILSRTFTDDEKLCQNYPYAKLFKAVLEKAQAKGVSDIHIEPLSKGIRIRFRLYGVLRVHKVLGEEHREALTSTIKHILNMDLAIVGIPQDSRASFKILKVDIRANSLNTLYGEKLVLRLLDQENNFNLSKSGLSDEALFTLRESISKQNGLILISGPTGSGKTTTLYALINEIDREKKNICSIEDPPEYELEGVSQVGVSKRLTFSQALRALMRQDPDVILVGEIRDKETAELCFKAASTGHLVLSTVHANGAKEVVERLKHFCIDTFTLKSNLRLSAAQRLLPLLCPHCSLVFKDKKIEEKLNLTISENDSFRTTNPKGCKKCNDGIIGRTAILEYLTKDSIEKLLKDLTHSEKHLLFSLQDASLKLAKDGKIDINRVLEIS